MGEKITGAQLAKLLGVSRQAINAALKAGRLSMVGRNERGWPLIDVDDAQRTLTIDASQKNRGEVGLDEGGRPPAKAKVRKQASAPQPSVRRPNGRPGSTPSSPSGNDESDYDRENFMKARAKREAAQAHLAEIKLQKQQGELISKEEARKQGAELGAILIGEVYSLPSRISPVLEDMARNGADAHDFQLFMERELKDWVIAVRGKLGLVGDPSQAKVETTGI